MFEIHKIRWIPLILFAIFFPFFASSLVPQAINLLIFTTLAIAWNLQGGYTGDLSFGHAAFFGIGAYSAAMMEYYSIFHFAPGNVFTGSLAAGIFAAIIGIPFLRLRGFYFAIGTLGLSNLLFLVFKNIIASITLGAAGMQVPVPSPYHIKVYYYSIMGVTLGCLLLSRILIKSKIGLAFIAIRDNREAAQAAGVWVTYYRILSFAISASLTGLAGAYYAYFVNYINPAGVFSATISFTMLVMVFLGGAGTLTGPLIGAPLLYILEEVARSRMEYGYYILPATLLIVVFTLMPNGIHGLIAKSSVSKTN